MQINAFAKVNLILEILGTESGKHLLNNVFFKIDLHDDLSIELADQNEITVSGEYASKTPADSSNLVWNVFDYFEPNFKSHIVKNIPVQAGLGGGSSDCASALLTCNELSGYPYSFGELMAIGASLGADVPFFLTGFQCALGTHFGEILTEIPDPPALEIELKTFPFGLSTASVFTKFDELSQSANSSLRGKSEAIDVAIQAGLPASCAPVTGSSRKATPSVSCAPVAGSSRKATPSVSCAPVAGSHQSKLQFKNDLTSSAIALRPELSPFIASGWHLSGSGPTLFRPK